MYDRTEEETMLAKRIPNGLVCAPWAPLGKEALKQTIVDLAHLRMAFVLASTLSKDPSTKVAAVILAPDSRKTSMGYNGMVAGAPETEEVWNNRELKYPRVVHAELNALLNCPFDVKGSTIYCTLHPCAQCLKAIIQAGIAQVVHYGQPWERETQDDVVREIRSMVQWRSYDADPVIEGIKGLFKAQVDVLPENLPTGHITKPEEAGWRPRETMPKDGTPFEGTYNGGITSVANAPLHMRPDGYCVDCQGETVPIPAHWRPIV